METCRLKMDFFAYDILKYNNLAKLYTFPNGKIPIVAIVEFRLVILSIENRGTRHLAGITEQTVKGVCSIDK